MPDTSAQIARIQGALRETAAARLTEAPHAGPPEEIGRRLLDAAESHGFDTTHLWGALSPDGRRIGQAVMIVPSSGRTGMLFTSTPQSEAERRELRDVLTAACASVNGVRLVQGLVEPEAEETGRSLQEAGFEWVAELLYLRRPWREPPSPPRSWPPDVEVQRSRSVSDADLMTALERTYVDTLDCPDLCRLRRTEDVLASHRATGRHDPDLWWLARWQGRPAGALLLNPSPDQGHTELVYLGLGPELRGRGLARGLLALGLRSLKRRRERTVTCAVDARNAPARKLYEEFGFREFGRRIAYVRTVEQGATR